MSHKLLARIADLYIQLCPDPIDIPVFTMEQFEQAARFERQPNYFNVVIPLSQSPCVENTYLKDTSIKHKSIELASKICFPQSAQISSDFTLEYFFFLRKDTEAWFSNTPALSRKILVCADFGLFGSFNL